MNTVKKNSPALSSACLVLCAFFAVQLFARIAPDMFETWNFRLVDKLFAFRSTSEKFRPTYDDAIVHVDLNNTTLHQLNTFYLDRSHYARLAANLSEMNVAAQMYDYIFAAPKQKENDRLLINAALSASNIYFGLAFELSDKKTSARQYPAAEKTKKFLTNTSWNVSSDNDPENFYIGLNPMITFQALAETARGLGYLNIKSDSDGVFRRAPLVVRYQNAFYPSFPFRVICDYLHVPPENIIISPGQSIVLKNATRPGAKAGHDIVIPIDSKGNLRVNFIGPWERMKHYNLADVLVADEFRDEMEMWEEELNGKIVIISNVSTGSSDIGLVPTDARFPLSGLHANVMHTILTESFFIEFSKIETICIELLLLLFIFILSLVFSSIPFTLASVATGMGYAGMAAFFFLDHQVIFQFVQPLLLVALAMGFILVQRIIHKEKEKEVLKRSFEAYLPPLVLKKLIANPGLIAEQSTKKELTILFSDIKSFTSHTAEMSPDHLRKLLNEYFEAMTEIVFAHEGTVDKFIGDGLMVFFGDPQDQPDHAVRCVRAAIDMQIEVKRLRKEWEDRGDFPLRIRIGINTGPVVVGNMGSPRSLSYTVLGPAVNLAQRLESGAPVDGILISARTHDLIKDVLKTRSVEKIKAKGFSELITVYEVVV